MESPEEDEQPEAPAARPGGWGARRASLRMSRSAKRAFRRSVF